MFVLAIDTTEHTCSVALMAGSQVFEKIESAPRRHSELLLPLVDAVLGEAGCAPSQMDLLAFSAGPGAFTGVRLAASAVQGLAFTWGCPVMPVSTLAALARGAHRVHGGDYWIPAMDARMGQVYWGAYDLVGGIPKALCADQLSDPDAVDLSWAQNLYPKRMEFRSDDNKPKISFEQGISFCQGIGSGWCYEPAFVQQFQAQTSASVVCVNQDMTCHAQDVAFCAQAALASGEKPVSAEEALPIYLRDVAFKKMNTLPE